MQRDQPRNFNKRHVYNEPNIIMERSLRYNEGIRVRLATRPDVVFRRANRRARSFSFDAFLYSGKETQRHFF